MSETALDARNVAGMHPTGFRAAGPENRLEFGGALHPSLDEGDGPPTPLRYQSEHNPLFCKRLRTGFAGLSAARPGAT